MVVFGSKSSSTKTKLFEQPLDKLFDPKAMKHFNETIAASNSRSPPPLCQSLSAPLSSSTLTWAKLSQENSATKRKRAAARLRRFTIDSNNNSSSLIINLTSAPLISPATTPSCMNQRLEYNSNSFDKNDEFSSSSKNMTAHTNDEQLKEDERCKLLLDVLPEPIKCLLNEIYLRGPSTEGIFRKSPNAKHCKELKQKLESPDFNLSDIEKFQVNVIASVFKEWLRSLPDCLLMSRLYPQWIDVAKLIEPLHLHYHQQQQQQLLQQQSTDHTRESPIESTSSFEDNSDSNLTKSPDGYDCKRTTSLRPSVQTPSPLTDNGQQQQKARNISPATGDVHGLQLSRALSCTIMASDSGHSSISSSPSSSSSSSFDSCEVAARDSQTGKHFQKVTPELRHLSASQSASYLKRKCYQQRQQGQCSIDYDPERNMTDLISVDGCLRDMTNRSSPTGNSVSSMSDFSLRERRHECIRVVRQLLEALNETNLILLRAIICVLWHIADNNEHNKMSSSNLGVCIGQSLLNDEQQHPSNRGKKLQQFSLSISSSSNLAALTQMNDQSKQMSATNFTKRHRRARSQCLLASTLSLTNLSHLSTTPSPTNSASSGGQLTGSISSNYLDSSGAQETAKYVPILVAFMIDNAKELFGSDVMNLFGPGRNQKQSMDKENNQTVVMMDDQSSSPSGCHQTSDYSQASSSANCERDGQSVQFSPPVARQTKDSPDGEFNKPEGSRPVDESTECKSIVVTRDQYNSVRDHSNLFVKMDAAQEVAHYTTPQLSQVKQHRRHMSTSVLVHVGSQPTDTSDHLTGSRNEFVQEKEPFANSVATKSAAIHPETATTSILIVNTPKKQYDQVDGELERKKSHCPSINANHEYGISNDLQLKGSLDRRTQLHHSSGHLRQEQQQPQRSHVMMLRDYYLSLQEQSQKQQQFQEYLKHHRRQQQQSKEQMLVNGKNQMATVTNTQTISNYFQTIQQQQQQQQQQQRQYRHSQLMMMQPPPVESRHTIYNSKQAHHYGTTTRSNAMRVDDATKKSCNGDHELMRGQSASASVAYPHIQPRIARTCPNQFNGLYVKRATSQLQSHEINGSDLIVLDSRHQTAVGSRGGVASLKPIVPSANAGMNLMAISQSSLSQQSSKMSSSSPSSDEEVCSSDDCYAGEWMESTMV